MNLQDYEQHKFAMADLLRLATKGSATKDGELTTRVRALFAPLAEDRFNLVVIGRFSRGKTSLMNAIMGTDRLPTGIVPLTSVITVTCGTKEQVTLHYDRRLLTREVPIASLPQYITQQGNPGNVQRIKHAEVHLRAEILRRGFYFVDRPGLGSAIVENTRTTESFLPEADAFIVVSSYEIPLSEEEVRFFRSVSASTRCVFMVMNKQNMVGSRERNEALAFVRQQLQSLCGPHAPAIFSVSARDGLGAKRTGDHARLRASGIPALEEALIKFLLEEKRGQFLMTTCDRLAQLLKVLPGSKGAPGPADQVRALAERISRDSVGVASLPRTDPQSQPEFPSLHQLRSCEVCEQISEAQWHYLCRFQYDIIVNGEELGKLAQRGGLCGFHTGSIMRRPRRTAFARVIPFYSTAWLRCCGRLRRRMRLQQRRSFTKCCRAGSIVPCAQSETRSKRKRSEH
jgi:GTP-binding protein EngB required for normal cell division